MHRILLAFALLKGVTVPANAQDTLGRAKAPFVALTPELERNAFADSGARTLLLRARAARSAQDSTLASYDSKTNLRVTYALGIHNLGADRLLMRTDLAARVKWSRQGGIHIEQTGARNAATVLSADFTVATPVPYWAGRDALWVPATPLEAGDIRKNDLLHPLADGAEAYYTYASGGALSIRLPNNRDIIIRELRISPRRPDWHSVVGSFWFNVESGHLVRAAYRLAADVDLWEMESEAEKQRMQNLLKQALKDTSAAGAKSRKQLEKRLRPSIQERLLEKLIVGSLQPVRFKLNTVSIEYGLHGEQFWMARSHSADAELQIGPLRLPMKWEERFSYESVTPRIAETAVTDAQKAEAADTLLFLLRGPAHLAAPTTRAASDSVIDSYNKHAVAQRARADSMRTLGDRAAAQRLLSDAGQDEAFARQAMRQRDGCAHDSTYIAGTFARQNMPRMVLRARCNPADLAKSADLPANDADARRLFDMDDANALANSLRMSLQPGWAPQAPKLMAGLSLLRYNRTEGLSLAVASTSALGRGYSARAEARYGFGDDIPHGELALSRTNGKSTRQVGVFHRTAVANSEWGAPLSVGASIGNLLFARDEGFYYRTWGAEISVSNQKSGVLNGASASWRLFAEQQRSAGQRPNTQGSLANVLGDARFSDNINAQPLNALGFDGTVMRTFGVNNTRTRLFTRARTEAAMTSWRDSSKITGYGRLMLDGTLTSGLGPFTASFSASSGASVGNLPVQRAFFVGGLQTVRGQSARAEGDGRTGNAFWLARTELGLGRTGVLRPTLFYDAGWAGPRENMLRSTKPLSGAGFGLSVLNGALRLDAARGISPDRSWRFDIQLGARF